MGYKQFIWLSNVAKILGNNFQLIKDTSQFNKDFMKDYNEESEEEYFLEVNVQYMEKLYELYMTYHFYLKE